MFSLFFLSEDMSTLNHTLQVYGFGVPPLRWILMAPQFLSYTWTLKDLRVLENQMYMMIGWLLQISPTNKPCQFCIVIFLFVCGNKCVKFFACGRIFALATVLSSVLIYNLPETVSFSPMMPPGLSFHLHSLI